MPRTTLLFHQKAELVHTIIDTFGIVVAELNFFPNERVLYVRWHGHLTSEEVIRVAEATLPWHQQLHPLGILNDKRSTSGDWGEAMHWLEYEWVPVAKKNGLRVFAYVLDADMQVSLGNAQVLDQLQQELDLRVFYSVPAAWRWLRQRTMPLLVAPAA
ncbi:hypothetical protein F0P96_13145 [Hymenobacter busanensis]|uniref:Uncharacterized protein n=1 Tax=Hymenobacter busanensis TaxID=2607656 RepID=A0A7L5A0J5_9BACT|nr:hypothetical protein [Hymenobacter busanensis]KAA9332413.1 hypothetical protein F0P96_13145 [Hymenobacter busanensis]QHJ07250.1 hypothetical protein GUY19_08130 [Hymenobacter busanensis]